MSTDKLKSVPNHIVPFRYPGKVERMIGQLLVVFTSAAVIISMWYFSGDMNTVDTILCCFLTWAIGLMTAIALNEMPPANEYSTDPYIVSVALIATLLIAPLVSDSVAGFYIKLPMYAFSLYTGQPYDELSKMLLIDIQM
ncbi:hypothetical protein FPW20_07585 [Vibrio cholerae]|uniref:hypothetical protein n=1 Tax=Vibrio cholerae TaxID=666 RepID=UPI001181EF54|nr:hypothetical protein [Vibrio cholerae]TVN18884.1 hypothetical protein FPW20_07585 [Vibrio cholerae]